MSANKRAKERLIQIFGNIDMVDETHIRKGKARYTGRKEDLTYHHLVPKSQGGKATVENGALVCEDNHQWIHKQNKHKQREITKAIEDYKACRVVFTDDVETDFEIVPRELILGKKRERNKGGDDR